MSGKLSMTSAGRVVGPAHIVHNDPFPVPNGTSGGMSVPSGVLGVLMHTMVSELSSCVAVFNRPGFDASAHFGISESGLIHQFGPINGWRAWHAMDANGEYYGIEHADAGNPNRLLTPQQITASAQLVELLSRVGHFPLQITNTPGGEGYGTHNMGRAAYGGHSCPDLPPNRVRSGQRGEIIALAKQIRAGAAPHPSPRSWTSAGQLTLSALCKAELRELPSTVLRVTVESSPGRVFASNLSQYVNHVFATDTETAPAGLTLHYPSGTWVTKGQLSLGDLASEQLKSTPAQVLALTCEGSRDAAFAPNVAEYINQVFARSTLKPAAGTVFHY